MKGGSFLYPALIKTVLLPPLFALVFLGRSPFKVGILLSLLICALSFPVSYIIRSYVSTLLSRYEAYRAGAVPIRHVKGRFPLNLDILLDWARSGSEEEVGRMMVLLGRKYGATYNTRVLGEDQIITTDWRVIKHVLVDDFGNFVKGKKFYQRAEGFLGDGIFNSDGDRWKFHRSLTRPFFHPNHISPDLFIPSIHRFLDDLPTPGQPFDIQAKLGQLALQVSILWLCGEDLSSDPSGFSQEWISARDQLGEALRDAQRIVGKRVKIGTIWPLFEIMHDPLEKPMRTIKAFFAPSIQKAIQRKTKGKVGKHLIDRLVAATEDAKLIEDQLINLMLASRDTTASLLTFLTYSVALHPEVAQRLRHEVRKVASANSQVDKDVIRDLKLCRAFINETLRLFPPVPLNIRRTLRPSLLPSTSGGKPLYMPDNTSIILATVLTHRDRSIWGDDAEEFNIDRWTNMGPEREAFSSWNIGPRMCLGQPLALALAHTFLVLLFQYLDELGSQAGLGLAPEANNASFRMPESWLSKEGDGRARSGRDKVWIVADVVLAVKGGLWVKVAR